MDDEKWNTLLLNWIDNTALIPIIDGDHGNLSIEETDLKAFFAKLIELLKRPEFAQKPVTEFIKLNYPDFELTSSGDPDEELPTRRDYHLIYSIFLHYGCVTCLDKCIQRSTQSLSAGEQLAVSVFLNYFLATNSEVTRPTLTAAIRDAVLAMDAKGNVGDDDNGPQRPDAMAFSTPKTARLEQNCREIIRLRGQVDHTDYEVSHLESLLRERDLKIANMKQREMDMQREMEELRRRQQPRFSYDSDDQRVVTDELTRKERAELRNLRRSNTALEDKVSNLLIEVDNLAADKEKLTAKLKGSTKEIRAYRERESELAGLIEDLNVDLLAKSQKISELLEVNQELESYISENKSMWNRNIVDTMNTSTMSTFSNLSDPSSASNTTQNTALNNSCSIASGFQRSTANLGSCVIDLQLKEKEAENAELKLQLVTLHDKSQNVQQGIERFLQENSAVREKCRGGVNCGGKSVGAWLEKIPEIFQALSEVLREKAQLESQVQGQNTVLARFREEREKARQELAQRVEKCAGMERELQSLRDEVKTYTETQNRDLDTFRYEVKQLNELMTIQQQEKESFKTAIEKGEADVYQKIRKIAKLNMVIERLRFEKRKHDTERKEQELAITRRFEMRLEEAKERHAELERALDVRDKQIIAMDEAKAQAAQRLEEMREAKEEAEKREERGKKEVARLKEIVDSLEKDVMELRRDKANLEAKLMVMSKNMKVIVHQETAKKSSASSADSLKNGRRTSILNQWTSTPRLSMKQKVKLDVELMKRRRISLLSPDDDVTSSESDNNHHGNGTTPGNGGEGDCQCNARKASRAKVARRDSLIFNSPVARKKKTSSAHSTKATILDRSAINRLQKQRRQSIFNKARDMLVHRESEGTASAGRGSGPVESLMWDAEYDLIALGGGGGLTMLEDFGPNTDQKMKNFQEILQKERCDAEDLFQGPKEQLLLVLNDDAGEGTSDEGDDVDKTDSGGLDGRHQHQRVEVSIERRAEESDHVMSTFEKSGASTIPNKSYSMNSGVYWGNERIPTASIVHLSPRSADGASARLTMSPVSSRVGERDLLMSLRTMSQENLLQMIVVVLFGILVCVGYQSVMY